MLNVYAIDTITISRDTVDKWGAVSATTTTSYNGRLVGGNKIVTDLAGKQVVSTARVMLPADADIQEGDRLTVNGVERQIISVMAKRDFSTKGYEVALA